jgi:excisionase family DNA binding protein
MDRGRQGDVVAARQGLNVRTLDLAEAAAFLKTTPDTVSAMIRREGLPACKVGRAWVLVDDDVVEWLRTRYGVKECESTNARPTAPVRGGSPSIIAADRLGAALARKAARPRKSTPTGSAASSGEPTDSANVRALHGTSRP